jgi:2-hydroxy-6-oxonona-2,4-dienedioate hydrolase
LNDSNERLYRQAEQQLWQAAGATPSERFIELAPTCTRMRIQEVGEGPPVLFIHGGPNSGSTWAFLAARLPQYRCLIVDRPGTGLSDSTPINASNAKGFADGFVATVLDALAIERADLVVSSFGGYIGLRSAVAHPERIRRMVQMGAPPLIPGGKVPLFMRLIMAPGFGKLLAALPPNEGAVRSMFGQIGHKASLNEGRIPRVFIDWYVALQKYTHTMRNEMSMIASAGSFFRGFDARLALDEEFLREVKTPTRFLWGSEEPYAETGAENRLVALMPHAEVEHLDRAGHLPWLDDPDHAATIVSQFLKVDERTSIAS